LCCALINAGISSRQGAHQVAQKFNTGTLPRHWDIIYESPPGLESDANINLWAAPSATWEVRVQRPRLKPAAPASTAIARNIPA
jgi:hypothetical protein